MKQLPNIVLFLSVVVLAALLILLIAKPQIAERFHKKLGLAKTELRPFYTEMISYQLRQDKNIPPNAHLFVGDSAIQSLCTPCIDPLAINFGIGGDTTRGVLLRLPQYQSLQTARSLFLSAGFNDYKYRDTQKIVENYQQILSLVPEDTYLIISALWSANPDINQRWIGYPEKTGELNSALRQLCSERENCYFFDITGLLEDSQGFLKKEYQTGDGIHLNRDGYAIFIDRLKELYSTRISPLSH